MEIAIQGHPIRGKEVIKILESLGGKKLYYLNASDKYLIFFIDDKGYISCFHHESPLVKECFKIYTLEEFEKEFPFKIGETVITTLNHVGTIIGIANSKYKVLFREDSALITPRRLKPYKEMKEERNITLTLEKAKEWYKKGGELKEIALQAFSEKELNPLPRSWEEFCEKYPIKRGECILEVKDRITVAPCNFAGNRMFKNWIPSKESAEAHLAMIQLEQLRDCWRQGWVPTPGESCYTIKFGFKGLDVYSFCTVEFLSFPTREMAEEFLECFKDLIEKAGDLI